MTTSISATIDVQNFASKLRVKDAATIAQLKEELRRKSEAFDSECSDVSRILAKIGMSEESARTDAGILHVPRICNHIQETLDALSSQTKFGADMVSKYSTVCKQLSASQEQVKMLREALREAEYVEL